MILNQSVPPMEESQLHFTGDIKNDDDIHQFIADQLPQYSPHIHTQLTTLAKGEDFEFSEEFDAVCEQPHVQKAIDAILVATLQDVRNVTQELSKSFEALAANMDAFISTIAPDLPIAQRELIIGYLHARILRIQNISQSLEEGALALCAKRQDVRDIVHFFLGHGPRFFGARFQNRFYFVVIQLVEFGLKIFEETYHHFA